MRKEAKAWLMVWCKVIGSMATTVSATLTVMGPHESMSAFQIIVVLSATFGTGALTLSSAISAVPGSVDPLSTGEIKRIFARGGE